MYDIKISDVFLVEPLQVSANPMPHADCAAVFLGYLTIFSLCICAEGRWDSYKTYTQ